MGVSFVYTLENNIKLFSQLISFFGGKIRWNMAVKFL